MKALFLRAPKAIRAAALLLPATPVVMTILWLRLYMHPKNPNGWLIIAVLGSVYAGIALLLLKGSNVTRWIWSVLAVAGLVRFVLGSASGLLEMGSIDTFVCVSMTIVLQLTVVALCFVPTSRAHFTTRKIAEPGAPTECG